MRQYILSTSDGSHRGCFDCGKPYLQCRCSDKPEAIVNELPLFQVGELVQATNFDKDTDVRILEIRYPVYTSWTSWNGAPVIVTDYYVQFDDGMEDWLSQRDLRKKE